MSALSKVGMSVLSLLVVMFGGCEVDATGWRPLVDAGKTSPAYGMDREALAELPGRADVPNGESYTMG